MIYLQLFWAFFKTGLFALGGGLATLPFLHNMTVSHPDWFTVDMLANMVAVSESTPGPLGVNMATYVGYTVAGIPGALLATFSLVLPSVVIILIIAAVLKQYMDNRWVQRGFAGVRPAVTGLIAAAGYTVVRMTVWTGSAVDWPAALLCAAVVGLRLIPRVEKVHPALFIVLGAVLGILLGM